jgi:hypothetical protein
MFPRPKYLYLDDRGTVTVEYALAMVAAVFIAGALLLAMQNDSVRARIDTLIDRAFTFTA